MTRQLGNLGLFALALPLLVQHVEDPSLAKGQGGLRTELTGNAAIGPSHRTLRLGGHHNGSEMFQGAIDNVVLFAGALGYKELESIRVGGDEAPALNCVGIYPPANGEPQQHR